MNTTIVVIDKDSILNMPMPEGNHIDRENWSKDIKELHKFFLDDECNASYFYQRFHYGYADVDLLKKWGAVEERWAVVKGGTRRTNVLTRKGINWAEAYDWMVSRQVTTQSRIQIVVQCREREYLVSEGILARAIERALASETSSGEQVLRDVITEYLKLDKNALENEVLAVGDVQKYMDMAFYKYAKGVHHVIAHLQNRLKVEFRETCPACGGTATEVVEWGEYPAPDTVQTCQHCTGKGYHVAQWHVHPKSVADAWIS